MNLTPVALAAQQSRIPAEVRKKFEAWTEKSGLLPDRVRQCMEWVSRAAAREFTGSRCLAPKDENDPSTSGLCSGGVCLRIDTVEG